MPDIQLTRKICESLHEAPDNIKERAEEIQRNGSSVISVKDAEKKRSDYQQPNMWVDWRFS